MEGEGTHKVCPYRHRRRTKIQAAQAVGLGAANLVCTCDAGGMFCGRGVG